MHIEIHSGGVERLRSDHSYRSWPGLRYLSKCLGLVVLLIGFAVVLQGCAPRIKAPFSDDVRREVATADRLMEKGDYTGAERIYRRLARKIRSPGKEHFLLLAAEALLKAGDNTGAKELTYPINPKRLELRDYQQYYLITAQVALNASQPKEAMERLNFIQTDQLGRGQQVRYYRQRAAAYALLGYPLEAARERVLLGERLRDPSEMEQNNAAILDLLSKVPEEQLIAQQPPPPDSFGGWMAFMAILKVHQPDSQTLSEQLRQWQSAFPNHPAMAGRMRSYVKKYHHSLHPPKFVAVLLPQAGPYTGAAEAVKEGIVAAYQRHPESDRPGIQFYDSHSADAFSVYRRAVAEGARFVIGPLDKENVRRLASGGELTVPVLALNQLPDLHKENLFQFGLNPVDEARQAASSAWFDGYQRALILVPSSSFGNRLAKEFSTYWQELGGMVREIQSYDPKNADFSLPVRRLLKYQTAAQYPDQRGVVVSDPQIRNDADFIFMVASPKQGRLLRSQLQSYRASHLPVYTTSLVYGGRPEPTDDRVLDGVVFCDIPFLFVDQLNEQLPGNGITPTNPAWDDLPGPYLRLIALGADSYNLAFHIKELFSRNDGTYSGLTGVLSLSAGDRLRRQLYCAQFSQGVPRVRGKGMQLEADLNESRGRQLTANQRVR
jgi:uncharacterized protein